MTPLAVHTWPDPAPARADGHDGLLAVLIKTGDASAANAAAMADADVTTSGKARGGATQPGGASQAAGPQRDAARHLIRAAARQALAAMLAVAPETISITSTPGSPPRVLLAGRPQTIGISISHEGDYALAAINLHGPVGADIMHIQDIPDWQRVARDYLGPAAAAALAAIPAERRASSFTSAWTQREAALKCHGLELGEWQTELPGRSISLALPVAGLLGHIHIGDNTA
ncbi:4'-phosphopantetheinyl transferase family protein [Duganella callida]|uniref:4'-phosphopantetheinyl transferase superfamily protein n=1 Tax=Duganella callida TaxID=2561932 RepID=A0A4Y9SG49_9BURK|nr:4'-phosphopantetheinyl transferase superfamily protein [Duganella callida]TFW22782.1 4'-phosphopantetheinyl transferase superfamily protein [Duganella callida]